MLLAYTLASRAEPSATELEGTFNGSQENGCIRVSLFYYRVDCSYENDHPAIDGIAIPWVGPTVNTVYYRPGSPETRLTHVPAAGDARITPALRGMLMIDDRGTESPDDDTISGTLVVGPAARNLVTRASANDKLLRVIESWDEVIHTLSPTAVTSARRLADGGIEYVIATKGFPNRLCRKADGQDCFPSAAASEAMDGKWGADTWTAPGSAPIGRSPALGGNIGAQTTAVMGGYGCIDNTGGTECRRGISVWGSTVEDPGLDNLLLRVGSDSHGHVTSVEGFWTQEYRVGGGPPVLQSPPDQDNSWLGGRLTLHAATPLSH